MNVEIETAEWNFRSPVAARRLRKVFPSPQKSSKRQALLRPKTKLEKRYRSARRGHLRHRRVEDDRIIPISEPFFPKTGAMFE